MVLREAIHAASVCMSSPSCGLTLAMVNDLASVLTSQGNFEEADAVGRRGVEARCMVPGARDEEMHRARDLFRQRKLLAAEVMLRDALELWRKTKGCGHPDTLLLKSNLAAILHKLGRDEGEATSHLEQLRSKLPSGQAMLFAAFLCVWVYVFEV